MLRGRYARGSNPDSIQILFPGFYRRIYIDICVDIGGMFGFVRRNRWS